MKTFEVSVYHPVTGDLVKTVAVEAHKPEISGGSLTFIELFIDDGQPAFRVVRSFMGWLVECVETTPRVEPSGIVLAERIPVGSVQ